MRPSFDPDAVRAQIANLMADRERLDHAISALQAALRMVEGIESSQKELPISLNISGSTLNDAVRSVCAKMRDGITRQRVRAAIEREYPILRPKSSSVAAALINLTKGENAMLKLAIPGMGASPAYYSTEGDTDVRLSADEIEILMDEAAVKGSGGWQSLWSSLQKKLNKTTGQITLTPQLRARLHQYYHKYGEGGWQLRAMKVFRRELPHIFVK